MSGISAHVLDTMRGAPAADLRVTLARVDGEGFIALGEATTNADGRVSGLLGSAALRTGIYRLSFETGPYFAAFDQATFFPRVEVLFQVNDAAQHYHIPLLLSPFAYSTYRGS